MFVDKADVVFQAGDGGDGKISFRHEKYVDRGGPDGGNGGNGGDIFLVGSLSQNTLATFRYQKLLKAEFGKPGDKSNKHGKSGKSQKILVPLGTVFVNEKSEILADVVNKDQEILIARGGKGGFGNAHFVSSKRQAPRIAEKGEKGELVHGTLELKMIADVGLVGLPNAGKSTLLSVISNARPEIANYPFTTLRPNLGVVDIDKNNSILVADIPGLIEGASQGKGLGDEFLRHVERTAVIIHIIDAYQSDLKAAYHTIQAELAAYKINLSKKPQIVVINKIDGLDEDIVADRIDELRKLMPAKTKIMAISAQAKMGLEQLKFAVQKIVNSERTKINKKAIKTLKVIQLDPDERTWKVTKQGKNFIITGRKIERFAERTNFESDHSIERLRDIMKKMGIIRELNRQKAISGTEIFIGGKGSIEF
ncbi:MAG: GTPase ObgE [Patescibacteria group bacterium]